MEDHSKITQQIKGLLRLGAGRNTIVQKVQLENEVNELDVKLRLTEYDLESRRRGCTHLALGCVQTAIGCILAIGFDLVPSFLAFMLSVLIITGAVEMGYGLRQIFYGIYKTGGPIIQALPVIVAAILMISGFFAWRPLHPKRVGNIAAYSFIQQAFFEEGKEY